MAHNGREALDRLVEGRPDVVLSDVMMPVLAGLRMWRLLHNDPVYRTIPLIFMRASALPSTPRMCPDAGFLATPCALVAVLDTLARVLPPARPPGERVRQPVVCARHGVWTEGAEAAQDASGARSGRHNRRTSGRVE